MNASKAKRRALRWYRYLKSTGSVSTNKARGGYHTAHAKAHMGCMTAGRAAPHGIRVPWTPLSYRPGA